MASGSQLRRIKCPLCDFCALSIQLVLSHLRLVHSSDPNFNVMCGISGCCTTSVSFSALYQHIYKKHKDEGIIKSRTAPSIVKPVTDSSNLFPVWSESMDYEYSLNEGTYIVRICKWNIANGHLETNQIWQFF